MTVFAYNIPGEDIRENMNMHVPEDKIAKKVRELKPSGTLLVNKKANEMKAAGEKVINLSVGEPDFDTPGFIKDAAIQAIKEGFTKYTDSSGIKQLREAICGKFLKDNDLSYDPDQIIVSSGAKHSLFNVFLAICDEGDEVIIPAPYWVSYPEMVNLAGGKPVICRFGPDYKIDFDHLKTLVNPKTKAIILNSPSNPSGIVYVKDELERIGKFIIENNLMCISDEVYEKLIYDGLKHVSIASLDSRLKDLTVVVNGVSKTYAMTGWRIGYLAASTGLAKAIANIQSQTTSNPVSISQKAALAAIVSDPEQIEPMVKEFEKRKNFLLNSLDSSITFVRPQGAFYLLFKIGDFTSLELAGKLLEEQKLATVPGADFGIEGFVRMSFATSMENLEEAVKRINLFAKQILSKK